MPTPTTYQREKNNRRLTTQSAIHHRPAATSISSKPPHYSNKHTVSSPLPSSQPLAASEEHGRADLHPTATLSERASKQASGRTFRKSCCRGGAFLVAGFAGFACALSCMHSMHACVRACVYGAGVRAPTCMWATHVRGYLFFLLLLRAATRFRCAALRCPFPGRARVVWRLVAADVAQGAELETWRQMCV